MKQFHGKYELLKDLPDIPRGSILKWDCWSERFTDIGNSFELNKPTPKVSYTLEVIEAKPDWFKGVGEKREYYPPFLTKKEFYAEENEGYGCGHYVADLSYRHNDMCRVCQLLNKLDIRQRVKDSVYEIIKEEYESAYLKG